MENTWANRLRFDDLPQDPEPVDQSGSRRLFFLLSRSYGRLLDMSAKFGIPLIRGS